MLKKILTNDYIVAIFTALLILVPALIVGFLFEYREIILSWLKCLIL